VNCDGSNTLIRTQKACFIPVDVFKQEPYNHPWGASIYARLFATNIKGDSLVSDPGNGCVIIYSPDAPVDVREDTYFRTTDTLGILWTAPEEDGGTRILDYRIAKAEQG
jgi:hypothetical protein